MTSGAVWVPLAAALGASVVTFLGTFVTQRRADRREDVRWKRDRDREVDAQSHKDRARIFDPRRDAYVSYMTMWREKWHIYDSADDLHIDEVPGDWLVPLYDLIVPVKLYGTEKAAAAAEAAFNAMFSYVYREPPLTGDGEKKRPDPTEAFDAFLIVGRSDLDVPD